MDVCVSWQVCDIVTVDSQGAATSLVETLLQAGLAHPMPGTPATFLSAYAKAETAAAGVFLLFSPALVKSRTSFASSCRALHFNHHREDYSISNCYTLHRASHMLVWESRE